MLVRSKINSISVPKILRELYHVSFFELRNGNKLLIVYGWRGRFGAINDVQVCEGVGVINAFMERIQTNQENKIPLWKFVSNEYISRSYFLI